MSKAVITGIGLVSPLGCDLQVCWDRLKQGYSGIRRVQAFDVTEYASKIAGEVVEFDADAFVPKKEQRRMDRYSILALGAAELAVRDAGLDTEAENGERMGCIVSSGIGGLQTLEEQHKNLLERGPKRCSPFMIPQMISNMGGGLIAIRYGLQGANYAIVSACASAAHSIGAAMRLIERGDADVMFSGGSEASVCPLGLGGFSSMRALSTRNDDPEHASRPFDAERDGFVIAEGAGVVIIESLEHAQRRGARIYCELAGFGETCDAYHMTAPMEDGGGAARAMTQAMHDAGLAPADIGYINAHGTSTPLNDKMETRAIKGALGEEAARKVMISSSKSMTGHLLGAAGGFETAVCALALHHGVLPPTMNYETPDPECDLDYIPNQARDIRVDACLSNSLGFGGHNACIAMRRMP